MSVFDRRVPLTEVQREGLQRRVSDTGRELLKDRFTSLDFGRSSPEEQTLAIAVDAFFASVFAKAAQRDFFSAPEREELVNALSPAIEKFLRSLSARDERLLQDYVEAPVLSVSETLDSYERDLASIAQALEGNGDAEEAGCLESIYEDLDRQRMQILAEIHAGRMKLADQVPKAERERFAREVQERGDGEVDPLVLSREIAATMTNEYERLLVTHKITTGLEANYSEEEILAHLSDVVPSSVAVDVRREMATLKSQRSHDEPTPVTSLQAYGRILRAMFGDRKTFAAGLGGAAVFLGYLAPQMAAQLGEFGRTGRTGAAIEGAGYGFGSALAQVELHRQLSHFLNTRLFGEAGLAQKMTTQVIGSSPELFTKTDEGLIRRYVEQTVASIEQISKTTVEGIGVRLSRIIGLASASAIRLQNPALFGPVVLAATLNTYIAAKRGQDISEADRGVRVASAEFTARFDEAVQVRVGRGDVSRGEPEVMARLEAARRHLVETASRYERASGIVMPVILLLNALLMDKSSPDFFANYAEASMYSMQLSGELSELVREVGELHRSLQPVVELANLTNEFREGGSEVPSAWELELVDVKRKALSIPSLRITPGDMLTVVGGSGTGKSTLLEVLYGFRAERGFMMVDEIMPSNLDKRRYRDDIALSNQFYTVETKSVRDNITSSGVPFVPDVFEAVLREHGFDDWLRKTAGGDDVAALAEQFILNKGAQLSGGERKRFGLMSIDYRLRVAPDSLKMILLDEPTSGVDMRHKQEVFKTIKRWRKTFPDKTIVVVNHDPELFVHLTDDSRILGINAAGEMVQDETLAQARSREDMPFSTLFGSERQGREEASPRA